MPDLIHRLTAALVDRYRVERELGRGGMAIVYLAEDLNNQRRVAIKVLKPEIAAALGRERFLREIAVTAKLDHPHILALHDSGEAGGFLYYVMPYVQGETLRDRLNREKQLPLDDAVQITSQVADALAFAHRHDVIHRDIKPENILLGAGHARVADFGIARAINAAGGDRLTETGLAVGTPEYMSPEQAAGETDLDGRSDVYALGCVLYEMLAGQPPFTGATPRAVIARQAIDPPPDLKTVRDTVPRGIETAIRDALAKVPADRFADAVQFRDAVLSGGRETVVAPRRARRRRLATTFAIAAALVAAVVALRAALRRPDRLDTNRVVVFPLVAPHDRTGPGTLGEDVATMIGTALDGVGPLRWIDGWAQLDPDRRQDARLLTLEEARRLARERQSAWFVTGRVVPRGDSAHVSLALHDVRRDVPVATGSATGTVAWSAGLRAVNGLLPTLIPGGATDLSDQWNDRVPAALASFLLGEAAFRRIRLEEASDHYRRAVELDSSFALAALRGAQAASWNHHADEAASLVAVAARQPLPPRYAAFVRGLGDYLDGRADSAIVAFRDAVAADPTMAVAWNQLGETYVHLLPRTGSPPAAAEAAFAEARRLDPMATNSLHLIEIWLRRGEAERAAPLVAKFHDAGSDDTSLVAKVALMQTCVEQGPARMRWDEIARARPWPLLATTVEFGGSQLACAGAGAGALLRTDTGRTEDAESRRFFAQMVLLNAMLAQGRTAEASEQLDAYVARWGSGTSLYLLAGPIHEAFGARARAVARADAARFGPDYKRMPFNRRLWALGVWEAHGGSAQIAAEVADELERRASGSGVYVDRVMAMSVRALATLARGDTTRALALLDALVPASAPGDLLKWDEALPLGAERLALARLFMARGAYQRAIEIADVFDSAWPVIYPLYLVPSLELRADAAGRLGERGRELEYRARLAALSHGL